MFALIRQQQQNVLLIKHGKATHNRQHEEKEKKTQHTISNHTTSHDIVHYGIPVDFDKTRQQRCCHRSMWITIGVLMLIFTQLAEGELSPYVLWTIQGVHNAYDKFTTFHCSTSQFCVLVCIHTLHKTHTHTNISHIDGRFPFWVVVVLFVGGYLCWAAVRFYANIISMWVTTLARHFRRIVAPTIWAVRNGNVTKAAHSKPHLI